MAVEVAILSGSKDSAFPSEIIITGHAIVSQNGMIADAGGHMPAELIVDADQKAFQSALDASALIVLGRKGHERHPSKGRRRLVATRSVQKFEPDTICANAYLWNPQNVSFASALDRLEIKSGVIAITGGQSVFELFLPLYDNFILTQVLGFHLKMGIRCFSAGDPLTVLSKAGLMQLPILTCHSQDDPHAQSIAKHHYQRVPD